MSNWKEKDLIFLVDQKYFPNCIECSEHYLDTKRKQFFHKKGCQHGAEDWETTTARLDERLEVFEKKWGLSGINIKCKECSNPAAGNMHVFYHKRDVTIEKWPVCMDHAFYEDPAGRETQFKGFNIRAEPTED